MYHELTIPKLEFYDSKAKEFYYTEPTTLILMHSLSSISEWEAKYHKPFLTKDAKSIRETIDYIRFMTINQVDPLVYSGITNEMVSEVEAYIQDPMTATWFSEQKSTRINRQVITSELVYYWMTVFGIPFECDKWHFNRLMTLIRVCSEKNSPRKMGKREQAKSNAALNAARRKARNSRG